MTHPSSLIRSPNSRVLLASHRNLTKRAFNSCLHELEDVICDIDSVDFFAPSKGYPSFQKVTKMVRKLTGSIALANQLSPAPDPYVLDREYDLLFINFSDPGYYYILNSLKGWREKCRKVVCYVTEVWRRDLPKWKSLLELYNDFDHIFVGHISILDEMEKITGRPCTYLPAAVDTIKFCPYPQNRPRGIDVSNIGRRSAITHQALLEMAEHGELFYYYDTAKSMEVHNHREHRHLFRTCLKHSRYFIANKAKANKGDQTMGQMEVGYRFFEGAASGAVMIGDPPDNEAFRTYFDWEDAVIPIPFDAENIRDILVDLDAQPDRLERIQRTNVTNSLLRHDWGYRWQQILAVAGLEPTVKTLNRNEQLKALAQYAQAEKSATVEGVYL
jgi:Glycosyl transferases group 1